MIANLFESKRNFILGGNDMKPGSCYYIYKPNGRQSFLGEEKAFTYTYIHMCLCTCVSAGILTAFYQTTIYAFCVRMLTATTKTTAVVQIKKQQQQRQFDLLHRRFGHVTATAAPTFDYV